MKLTTIKSLVAIALVAAGMSAIAVPTVTVDKVVPASSWSKIIVRYTIGGTDAEKRYKVIFDLTVGGRTASVTNEIVRLSNGAASKEIDTVKLFNGEVIDEQAKVEVSLVEITVKKLEAHGGIQLWEDGPYWATNNVGGKTELDSGGHYSYQDVALAEATAQSLETGWRLPTKAEFEKLIANCTATMESVTNPNGFNSIMGVRFTGKNEYASNSIFLRRASYEVDGVDMQMPQGYYWSSDRLPGYEDTFAYYLGINTYSVQVNHTQQYYGYSVREVRDAIEYNKVDVIVTDKEGFELLPPSVTINGVMVEDSQLEVNYTIGGTDEESGYGVAFDLTMNEQTARVRDSSRNFLKGTYTKTLNLTELFGGEVAAEQVKVKVSLIMRRFKDQGGVQLWEDGPFWAECNLGGTLPADYGEHIEKGYAKTSVSEGWRLPSVNEFIRLFACKNSYTTDTDSDGNKIAGQLFEGADGDLFLPAAGYTYSGDLYCVGAYGFYWCSDTYNSYRYVYYFSKDSNSYNGFDNNNYACPVRAVRDATVVVANETEIALGQTSVKIVPNAAEPTIVKTIKVENSFLNAIVIAGNPDATPAEKLYAMGANGIVNWQNAILRLSPTVATDKPYLNAVANSAVGSSTLKLFHGAAGEPLSPRSDLGISVRCKVVAADNPAFTGTTIEWNCADDGSVTVELPTPSIGNSEARYFKPELIFE